MTSVTEGSLFGLGNPLLDLVVTVEPEFLNKYNLEPNGSVLASEVHQKMFQEIKERYKVEYIAGGSMQNTLRVAQWVLGRENVSVFMGAIGGDEFGEIISRVAVDDGVKVKYQIIPKEPTGVCAILVTGRERSMCANIAAASHFTKDHMLQPDNYALLSNARVYHVSGYFFTVCPASLNIVAQLAASTNRPFTFNLNATYLMERFANGFRSILPYCDILFGNESEARALSKLLQFDTEDIEEIVLKTLTLPKVNKSLPRIVVFTQGSQPVILGESTGESIEARKVTSFPVPQLEEGLIKDTSGAGDAFVGGFLAQYLQQKSLQMCVNCGIWAATQVIQQIGCTFPKHKRFLQ